MNEIVETLNELLKKVNELTNKVDKLLTRNQSYQWDGICIEEDEEVDE